nr:TetR/AcrR family transcriptional regulator [Picosynechococcus sp. NKBG15041c]
MVMFQQRSPKTGLAENCAEDQPRDRILKAALQLFAQKGYEKTTTKELAEKAKVAEGTLFRHFSNKKSILVEVATLGWMDLLTDFLTEMSEMGSCKAIAQVMRHRMLNMHKNKNLLKVCFIEAQAYPELKDTIQAEVIDKMTGIAEAFFESAMEKGIYRKMNPHIVAQVFLGMFAIAGFSDTTIAEPNASPESLREMAEGIADIFLNGVLA